MRIGKSTWAGIGLTVGLVVGGVSWAGAHGGDATRIHACVADRGGAVRVVGPDESCKKGETPLDWNATGTAGTNGRDGTDGRTVWSGSGAPATDLGAPGDFYIDTQAWEIYGPKQSSGWSAPTSLIGPAGADGAPGADGADGTPAAGSTCSLPGGGTGTVRMDVAPSGAISWSCFVDSDADGLADGADNCPTTANPDQVDADGDALGDLCDPMIDADLDGAPDATDNCPGASNPDQADSDGDGLGDLCDPTPLDATTDADSDGFTAATGDCNDDDATINPDATEVVDGVDENCDGILAISSYPYSTGATFENGQWVTVGECRVGVTYYDTRTGSYSEVIGDVGPQVEVANGLDDDCDGVIDDV